MGSCLSQLIVTAAVEQKSEQTATSAPPKRSSLRFVSLESPRSPLPPRYINAAYWPNWIAYHARYPSSFDLTKLSHVFYAYTSINPDGTISCTDDQVDVQVSLEDDTTGFLSAWAKQKLQHPQLKVILSVGGDGACSRRYARVCGQAQNRQAFASSARSLLQLYNLDGIDLNWDPASAEEGQNLLELIKAVRKSFKGTRYIITACLSGALLDSISIDLAALGRSVDLVNLLAYDFRDSRAVETRHQAQLYCHGVDTEQSCEGAVEYLKKQGIPPNKILLGLPLFGKSYLGKEANGPYQPFEGLGGTNGAFAVRDLPRPGTSEEYDDELGAAWCASAGEFVSYDNADSTFDKAWYCRDAGLAGICYWHLGYDRAGERSLIRKGWETLNESRGGHS